MIPEIRGFGAGLRREHYEFLESRTPHCIEWFEAISENYMDSHGRPRAVLEMVRRDFPVALHGVSMSLGRADGLNLEYLARLRELVRAIEPGIVSDHMCWTGLSHNLHDLLPLPFTAEALDVVCAHIDQAQEFLGRRILVENVSSYVTFRQSEMSEWEFLNACMKRTGCGLLLDVNNVFVSAENHGFDPGVFLRSLLPGSPGQMHLAGHTDTGKFLFDTHSEPVPEAVWTLFALSMQLFPGTPVSIEWDENIPSFERLEAEVSEARRRAG